MPRIAPVALALLLAACGSTSTEEIRVSAASSLTEAFGDIETAFEAANPGVDVVLNLGGSSALREQILGGAPVDVFASANPENMRAVDGMIDGAAVVFARNHLQLAVPSGNPGAARSLTDLERPELFVGLCAEPVPCGSLAHQVLDGAGIRADVDTFEPDVRSLVTKLEASELDAGLVYATDVLASDEVSGVGAPSPTGTDYEIAALGSATDPALAADFVAFVLSDEGQAILTTRGFATP